MSVEVKSIVMVGVSMPASLAEGEQFYDDMDEHSSFKEGKITYLFDGMCGEYLYIGEVLFVEDDVYNGSVFELDLSELEDIKFRVSEFIIEKFGYIKTPKIIVVNHVY